MSEQVRIHILGFHTLRLIFLRGLSFVLILNNFTPCTQERTTILQFHQCLQHMSILFIVETRKLFYWQFPVFKVHMHFWPSVVALLVAMSLGIEEVLQSILTSSTFFCEDLVMKIFLCPFFFHWFKKSWCPLMAKEYKLSTAIKPPVGGLPWKSLDMTQTQKHALSKKFHYIFITVW